jgi:hypothetical protein
MTTTTHPTVDVETEPCTVWLAFGDDDRTLDVFDAGMDFRGLADDVFMPAEAFIVWLDDLRMYDNFTIAITMTDVDDFAPITLDSHSSGVGVTAADNFAAATFDSNSGTLTDYAPMLMNGATVYRVEGFGFMRVQDGE